MKNNIEIFFYTILLIKNVATLYKRYCKKKDDALKKQT